MKLYLIRHGETPWNKLWHIQGCTNVPLNENGISVAQDTDDAIKKLGIHFDKVYASPLDRAYKTAEILCQNNPITVDDRLREISFGDYEGTPVPLIGDPSTGIDQNVYNCFFDTDNYIPHNGESIEMVCARAESFLEEEILNKNWDNEQNILIVAHGGIIRAFLSVVQHKKIKDFWNIKIPNVAVTTMNYDHNHHTLSVDQIGFTYYEDSRIHKLDK